MSLIPEVQIDGFRDRFPLGIITVTGILAVLAAVWLSQVTALVPEPYLDEVFHVPQAQKYCQGQFWEWDDKITTPPGLYATSVALETIYRRLLGPSPGLCSTFSLRTINSLAVLLVGAIAALCRHELEEGRLPGGSRWRASPSVLSTYAVHTALNIALFPVLFFFSALYYTDVLSTALVLAAYWNQLSRLRPQPAGWLSDVRTVALGLSALFTRQTNIFWVCAYMAGLEAAVAIKALLPAAAATAGATTGKDRLRTCLGEYAAGYVHDPPLSDAHLDDFFFCGISLAIAAINHPLPILRRIWPHVLVATAFSAFVAWNRGVVLGDKSNHVARLHIPQMLYIWPCFIFFSYPLLLLDLYAVFLSILPRSLRIKVDSNSRSLTMPGPARTTSSSRLQVMVQELARKVYLPIVVFAAIVFSAIVIHFNTIIHPFTLADNRHYMFYIFRYSIRRLGFMRYLLVIPYLLSSWLCWRMLCGQKRRVEPSTGVTGPIYTRDLALYHNHPFIKYVELHPETDRFKSFPSSFEPATVSTALLWVGSTTLSLITAPLVEPRYFIMPWVLWRLLVPSQSSEPEVLSRLSLPMQLRGYDVRLYAETAWFLLVNLVTMFIFLHWPYQWWDEDGALLDGGRLQRFMW